MQLKIKFNDDEDDIFEYPSEAFMLKTYDCNQDQQNGFKIIGNEEDNEIEESKFNESNDQQRPPIPKRSKNSKLSSSLKSNTIIGALNGKFCSNF